MDFVKKNQDKIFYITPIGTGLAKFKHEEIAPMFKEIAFLENVKICPEWQKILKVNK